MGHNLFIFDIDGVLADCTHRLKYREQNDYDGFYSDENISKDEFINAGGQLFNIMSRTNEGSKEIIFITGRPHRTRKATEKWLWHHKFISYEGANDSHVMYRKDGDYRPSSVVKAEMVDKVLKARYVEPVLYEDGEYNEGHYTFLNAYFIDDDPKNVKAVEQAYPIITGIIFTTKRLKDE